MLFYCIFPLVCNIAVYAGKQSAKLQSTKFTSKGVNRKHLPEMACL